MNEQRRPPPDRPYWAQVLRAVREAAGVSQDGWAARLEIARSTLQRWERGEVVPDATAEQALMALCQARGLFHRYERGPLQGVTLSAEWLQRLLAEARLALGGAKRQTAVGPVQRADTDSGQRPPFGLPSLPAAMTSFVGRAAELAELARLLHAARLVTLMGAGGVGKTRLALEAAHLLADRYQDGVCLVEFAGIANPALLPAVVAKTLNLDESAWEPGTAAIIAELRTRELLLILDNCEHLVTACAELAGTLLRGCPRLRVLATSRTALGIEGEVRLRVPSLPVPDAAFETGNDASENLTEFEAVRLFVDRANAVQPAFRLTAGNAPAVAKICRRLDGIPLALELAAVRLSALSATEVAARLDDRFGLLTRGSRTALPRHQTLRAALDWSHDLLSEPEHACFRRLAVFAGSFSMDAAEAVCGNRQSAVGNRETPSPSPIADCRLPIAAIDVVDLFAALVDHSLVLVDGRQEPARYHLLETIRQYAAERLAAAGEADALRLRHLDWYLSFAERAAAEMEGPRQVWWLNQLELEHDNLRAALGWAIDSDDTTVGLRLMIALKRFWLVRGHGGEGERWLERALPLSGATPATLRAEALQNAAELAARRGDYALSADYQEQSLALWRSLGDTPGVAGALRGMGVAAAQQGLYRQARDYFAESLATFRAGRDERGAASVLANLGLSAAAEHDTAGATSMLEEALNLFRKLGNTRGVANALDNLGYVALAQRDAEQARAYFTESLALFAELGDIAGLVRGLEGAAAIAVTTDLEASAAARLLGGAEALRAVIGVARAPADQGIYEGTLAAVRTSLAGNLLAEAWTVGRNLTPKQLHDLALITFARQAQA